MSESSDAKSSRLRKRSDLSGGRAKPGAAAKSEHCSVVTAAHENQVVGQRVAESIPAWTKADGHRRRQWANAAWVCSGAWVVAPGEWWVSQSREGLASAGPVAQAVFGKATGGSQTGGSGRSSVDAMGQQNPGRAKDPWGSGVLHRAKIAPTCLRANGNPRSRSRVQHSRRIKLAASTVRQGGPESCGAAVLKPYWGKPAVRNFRGVARNGATVSAKRARSWKRRIQPSPDLRVTALSVYSSNPHARFERGS